MKAKLKIRRDDTVMVIAGKSKGKIGKVVRVLPEDGRLVVEGASMVKRHVKAQGQQAGSLVEKEAAIDISNVALWSVAEGRRIKVGYSIKEDGTKVRIDRKTGATV